MFPRQESDQAVVVPIPRNLAGRQDVNVEFFPLAAADYPGSSQT